MSATADAVEIEEITGEIVAGTPVLFKFKDNVVDKTINLSATEANIEKRLLMARQSLALTAALCSSAAHIRIRASQRKTAMPSSC